MKKRNESYFLLILLVSLRRFQILLETKNGRLEASGTFESLLESLRRL